MKKLLFLFAFCPFLALGQGVKIQFGTTNTGPNLTNIIKSIATNAVVENGLNGGGSTNGIQMLNGYGTNTTLFWPTIDLGSSNLFGTLADARLSANVALKVDATNAAAMKLNRVDDTSTNLTLKYTGGGMFIDPSGGLYASDGFVFLDIGNYIIYDGANVASILAKDRQLASTNGTALDWNGPNLTTTFPFVSSNFYNFNSLLNSNRLGFTSFGTNVYFNAGLLTEGGSGDVNLDGSIALDDYVLITSFLNNATNFTDQQKINSDANGDGRIDFYDQIIIYYIVSGFTKQQGEHYAYTRSYLLADGTKHVLNTNTVLHGNINGATNLPIAGISASGSPGATTYLRGDGTWAPVSAGAATNAINNLDGLGTNTVFWGTNGTGYEPVHLGLPFTNSYFAYSGAAYHRGGYNGQVWQNSSGSENLMTLSDLGVLAPKFLQVSNVQGSVAWAAGVGSPMQHSYAKVPDKYYNTWFELSYGVNLTASNILQAALTYKTNGLLAAGYDLIQVDDGWTTDTLDANGNYVVDATYIDNITNLVAAIHTNGFRFGIYVAGFSGPTTGNNTPGLTDPSDIYSQAEIFASWGVDNIKLDYVSGANEGQPVLAKLWSDAIARTGRKMTLLVTDEAWSASANASDFDLYPEDYSFHIYANWLENATGPGYTYPAAYTNLHNYATNVVIDRLANKLSHPGFSFELAIFSTDLKTNETRHHLIYDAMFSSALQLHQTVQYATNILYFTNANMLRVLNDPAWRAPTVAWTPGGAQSVWVKALGWTGQTNAVGVFNWTNNTAALTLYATNVGLPADSTFNLREVWGDAVTGPYTNVTDGLTIGVQDSRFYIAAIVPTVSSGSGADVAASDSITIATNGLLRTPSLSTSVTNWIEGLVASVNQHFYFSSVTQSFGITVATNCFTSIDSPVATAATNAVSVNGLANAYWISYASTNTISRLETGPVELDFYYSVTGAGPPTVTAHPELYVWLTNDTLVEVASSGDLVYSGATVQRANIAMNVTTSTNLPYGSRLLLRMKITSEAGTPTFNFIVGGDYDSHLAINVGASTAALSSVDVASSDSITIVTNSLLRTASLTASVTNQWRLDTTNAAVTQLAGATNAATITASVNATNAGNIVFKPANNHLTGSNSFGGNTTFALPPLGNGAAFTNWGGGVIAGEFQSTNNAALLGTSNYIAGLFTPDFTANNFTAGTITTGDLYGFSPTNIFGTYWDANGQPQGLGDPAANAVWGWDDTYSSNRWYTAGSGITLSGGTIVSTAGGNTNWFTDADEVFGYDTYGKVRIKFQNDGAGGNTNMWLYWHNGNSALQIADSTGTPQLTLASLDGNQQVTVNNTGVGFAGNVTLPSGAVATTQSAGDNDTSVATTAFTANATNGLATHLRAANNHLTGSNSFSGNVTFALPPLGSGNALTNLNGTNVTGNVPSALALVAPAYLTQATRTNSLTVGWPAVYTFYTVTNTCALTNVTGATAGQALSGVMILTNSTGTPYTVTLPSTWTTTDGLNDYYVTNGQGGTLSVLAVGTSIKAAYAPNY